MAVKPAKFFKLNEDKAGSCLAAPHVEARRVKAGDVYIQDLFQHRAKRNGWLVIIDDRNRFFLDDEDFARRFEKADLKPEHDLPSDAVVSPVAKGQEIAVQPWEGTLNILARAEVDGYLVQLPEKGNRTVFMSQAIYHATFNAAAARNEDADQGIFRYVPQARDKLKCYIVLEADTVFDFKSGEYAVPAGSVLFEDENDEDGFTAMPAESFAPNFRIIVQARTPLVVTKPREILEIDKAARAQARRFKL